jgi:hypothetical protein
MVWEPNDLLFVENLGLYILEYSGWSVKLTTTD